MSQLNPRQLFSKYKLSLHESNIIDAIDGRKAKEIECCPHHLYESPEQFSDDMLWILCQKSAKSAQTILGLIDNHLFCTYCINSMLSKLSFKDMINLVKISFDDEDILTSIGSFVFVLYHNLLFHPKIPKIMMKACKMNKRLYFNKKSTINKIGINNNLFVHEFHAICSYVIGRMHDVLILSVFYESIKYWNQYHALFFITHYWSELKMKSKFVSFLNKKKNGISIQEQKSVVFAIRGILTESYSKIKSIDMVPTNIRNEFKMYSFNIKIPNNHQIYQKYKDCANCEWYKCNKLQSESSESFKICSGCKMTFFCSRRCQKKSWKFDHRHKCNILSKRI